MATVFEKTFAAKFLDVGGAYYQPEHPRYGAKGNGSADDWQSLVDCYDDVPEGSTIVLSRPYLFTQPLIWNKGVHIISMGPRAALIPEVGATEDAIIVNDTAGGKLYNVRLSVAVLNDTPNCCKNGMVFNRCCVGQFDLHVKVTAAEWGVITKGCLISRFGLVVSVNFNYPTPAGMPALGGIKGFHDLANAVSNNANTFDLVLENAVAEFSDGHAQGNNKIMGTIEGCGSAAPALLIDGMVGVNIQDLHLEGNTGPDLRIVNSADVHVGPSLETDGEIEIEGSFGVDLDGVTCNTVELIGAGNHRISTGVLHYNKLGTGSIIDPNNVIQQLLPIVNANNLGTPASFDGEAMAVPNTGSYVKGYFAPNHNKVIKGVAGSQYILRGWDRLTTGAGHILNTDWAQARTLTGT